MFNFGTGAFTLLKDFLSKLVDFDREEIGIGALNFLLTLPGHFEWSSHGLFLSEQLREQIFEGFGIDNLNIALALALIDINL